MTKINKIISDITSFIFVSDKSHKADIIFLPGGSFPEIPEKAAELYNEGYAPFLLPSGGVSVKTSKFAGVKSKQEIYDKDYQTECEFYTDALLKNGVPQQAILCEDKSGHTKDNAFFSRRVADANGLRIKNALIVCKSFHARRCLMLYQLAFPEAEIFVCPVDCYGITKNNWHTFEYGIERVLGELARCGNQFIWADMSDLSCVDGRFDVVFSSLAVHYIKDFDSFVAGVGRVLVDGGIFIFSQEHPLTTAPPAGASWTRDENMNVLHYNLMGYMRSGQRSTTWIVGNVIKYHRPFSEIVNALIGNGFIIEKMIETVPTEETIKRLPHYAKDLDKPNILLIRAKRGR